MAIWIFLGIAVLVLCYVILIYNRLVRLRALVRESWSGITVQLRRRADLVPNLISAVKGYASHERELLETVTAHRGDAISANGVGATAQACVDCLLCGSDAKRLEVLFTMPTALSASQILEFN